MIKAGALKDQITLQVVTQNADATGGAGAESWANIASVPTVWGSIEPLSGREFFQAQQMAAEVTHKIRIRWRGDLILTPKHRATTPYWPGSGMGQSVRVFDIVAVLETDRRRETQLLVKERV